MTRKQNYLKLNMSYKFWDYPYNKARGFKFKAKYGNLYRNF